MNHSQQQQQLLRSLHGVQNVNAHNNSLQWWMLESQRRTVLQLALPAHFIVLCKCHSQASYTRFALRCRFTDSQSDKLNFENVSRLNFPSSAGNQCVLCMQTETTGLFCKWSQSMWLKINKTLNVKYFHEAHCKENLYILQLDGSIYTSSHVNLATRGSY